MTKLTGAALDQAVANVLGIKSVHNCEKWKGGERTWQGLTDEKRSQLVTLCHGLNEYGQVIEAEEKNA
jgi:hypothetical protein